MIKQFKQTGHKIGTIIVAAGILLSCIPSAASTHFVSNTAIMAVAASTSTVTITEAVGAEETVYATWDAVTDATGYHVYIKTAGGSYSQVDSMLVRQYSTYFRVDVPGLAAGSYVLKIVPVMDDAEDTSKQAETATLSVSALDRTGFSFYNESTGDYDYAVGAYSSDGTLKEDAVILYLTESTKDTMTLDVVTSSKGATTSATGLQNILDLYKKGYDTRPLCIRVIGKVTDPETLTSGDLLFSGSGDSSRLTSGITLEGIGEDATIYGFGIRLKNISGMEVRNIGIMLVDSDEGDNLGLQQSNDHIWVHNCDFFYGEAGSDADQAKGDGALDCKKSTYITFSYNHFWDNGKCNLLGLSEGTTEGLYITYHHNWYDHSDSRHPRVRYYSAHIYNNYYDGNAKYGMGSTLGSSLFSENNYFRNCKYPMLISMQGSDIANGTGTFSSEDGGIIKAYGNKMSGQTAYVTYQEDNTEFDAYEVSSRTEQVPSTVTSKQGDHTYNNFDTSDIMYSYTADDAEDVPEIVMANAGRLNGGDFQWEFDDSVDDESYAVNSELMAALQAYTSNVVAIGSGFSDSTEETDTTTTSVTTTVTTTTATEDSSLTTTETTAATATSGAQIHNFTLQGTESTFYAISGNLSTTKGTVIYDGLTLTQCLKMESATSIAFTTTANGTLTLVFLEEAANVYVDGEKYTANGDGIISVSLSAGEHTITKADTANLYYMIYADTETDTTTTNEITTETTSTTSETTAIVTTGTDETADSTDSTTATTAFVETTQSTTTTDIEETSESTSTQATSDAIGTDSTVETTTTMEIVTTETQSESDVDETTTQTLDTTEQAADSSATTTTTTRITIEISDQFFGDVSLDGTVSLADSVLLNKAVAGLVTLSEGAKSNADVNADSYVDADDALVLLKYQVNLISSLPAIE